MYYWLSKYSNVSSTVTEITCLGEIFGIDKGSTDRNQSVQDQNRKNEKFRTGSGQKNEILRPILTHRRPGGPWIMGIDYTIDYCQ